MRIVVTFDEVSVQATRKGSCTACGGVTQRSRTFPLSDGVERSAAELEARAVEVAREWSPEPSLFDHVRCA